MGTWGTGIFDNDDAGDVREEFRDLIAAGKSADEATAGLVESYGAADVDLEDHDFWLALAATQHSPGHVGTGVIERAITIIDDPAELERWDPSDARRRRAALKKLRSRLQKKPRSPKRLRARRGVDTALEEGQHLLFDTGTRVLLLRVLGVSTDKGGRYPFVMLLDWDGTEASLEQAHRLPGRLDPGKNRREGERMGSSSSGSRMIRRRCGSSRTSPTRTHRPAAAPSTTRDPMRTGLRGGYRGGHRSMSSCRSVACSNGPGESEGPDQHSC